MLVKLFLVVMAIVGAYCNDQFVVDINENGVLVQQTVTTIDDLQIIHVPAHRDLEEVNVYLDFKNGVEVVKLIKQNKCQLSNIDPGVQPVRNSLAERQNGPLDSSLMQHSRMVRLETDELVANRSYLRQEVQEACANMPIYRVDSVNEELYYSKRNSLDTLTVGEKNYQFSAITRNALTCTFDGQVLQGQTACPHECLYQICNPSNSNFCFYNALQCPIVTPSCWQHITSVPLSCTPCCSSPKVPCGSKLQYCGCLASGQFGK